VLTEDAQFNVTPSSSLHHRARQPATAPSSSAARLPGTLSSSAAQMTMCSFLTCSCLRIRRTSVRWVCRLWKFRRSRAATIQRMARFRRRSRRSAVHRGDNESAPAPSRAQRDGVRLESKRIGGAAIFRCRIIRRRSEMGYSECPPPLELLLSSQTLRSHFFHYSVIAELSRPEVKQPGARKATDTQSQACNKTNVSRDWEYALSGGFR
jgi:hypothetical protein